MLVIRPSEEVVDRCPYQAPGTSSTVSVITADSSVICRFFFKSGYLYYFLIIITRCFVLIFYPNKWKKEMDNILINISHFKYIIVLINKVTTLNMHTVFFFFFRELLNCFEVFFLSNIPFLKWFFATEITNFYWELDITTMCAIESYKFMMKIV